VKKKLFCLEIIIWFVIILTWLYFGFFHCFDDDEFQHCHNAFLIWKGLIPYKDFFEHHLPLYHVLFSPLFIFGAKPASIFLFRIISILASAGVFFILYRYLEKTQNKSIGLLCCVLLGFVPMYLFKMIEARPEPIAVLLYAGAVINTLSGRDDYKNAIFSGILSGLMVCFSQKYFFAFLGIFAAWFILKGKKTSLFFFEGFIISILPLFLYLLLRGILPEFINSTVVMNLKWRYRFSPAGYLYEAFITAGFLIACGMAGILTEFFEPGNRKKAIAILSLIVGCFLGIIVVPVPYRQTYLPLFIILTISSGTFLKSMSILIKNQKLKMIVCIIMVFCAISNASIKIYGEIHQTNRSDLLTMAKVDSISPQTQFFDGRCLLFYRMHTGYYGFMHHELLQMLDEEKYSNHIIEAIKRANFPVIIYDYRVKQMPAQIQNFIQQHYCAVDNSDIYMPGLRIDRTEFINGKKEFEIYVSGYYTISWTGGNLLLDGRHIEKNVSEFLDVGIHTLETEEFVDNLVVLLKRRR